jgi:hypothetical protein
VRVESEAKDKIRSPKSGKPKQRRESGNVVAGNMPFNGQVRRTFGRDKIRKPPTRETKKERKRDLSRSGRQIEWKSYRRYMCNVWHSTSVQRNSSVAQKAICRFQD